MDSSVNSLRLLPAAQRFQIMTYLSMMWTTIFCIGTGAWLWYGHLVVAHIGVAFGVAITSWTFFTARNVRTYRDSRKKMALHVTTTYGAHEANPN